MTPLIGYFEPEGHAKISARITSAEERGIRGHRDTGVLLLDSPTSGFPDRRIETLGSHPLTRSWRCSPAAFDRALAALEALGAITEGATSGGTVRVPAVGAAQGAGGSYVYDGECFTLSFTSSDTDVVQRIWEELDRVMGFPVARA